MTASMPNVDDPGEFNHCLAEVNRIRLHYVDKGEGPLVVLLHGFPTLWYLSRHQIKVLAAAGYRMVAPDQRGHGRSRRGQRCRRIRPDTSRWQCGLPDEGPRRGVGNSSSATTRTWCPRRL
ncbi:alpha/beta fold hydrolase [Nocardia sp. NBC_00565]|uniref:alpha/beta fold hydrolase n=1 Tax=Nocardia sp. NBC_00565 TaxID=2975993 RepID=UPI002E81A167|nr:alpha/beta fold hydrolase [Nocardia sp. NBC_00565]